jgi:hypothetical protein
MRKSIFLVILLLSGATIHAQETESLKNKYINETIYRYGSSIMKGTERLSFPALQREFSMSELGLAAYTKSKKYKTTSIIFRFISLGSSLAALAIASENNLTTNRRNLAFSFLGGQIVFGLVATNFSMLSNKSLDKALWQRNKDLLFPAR